ncbi:MAG: methyltransferase domain-containing protein [Deltaproteobacteria bacterium]|nr:methyltransferase domain-containing protein [Deltaproteobacteria bacterium]
MRAPLRPSKRRIARHLLYQRAHLKRLARIGFLRRFFSYKSLVAIEAFLAPERIIREYDQVNRGWWEEIKPHLPQRAGRVLDIGCGLGGIDELVYGHFSRFGPVELYLADRDYVSETVTYDFAEESAAYNSLALTRAFLVGRGVDQEAIQTVDVDKAGLPGGVSFDLILSFLSWGFHFPVETYLDYAKSHLNPDGVLLLDTRTGMEAARLLGEHFVAEVVYQDSKVSRIRCRHRQERVEEGGG